MIFVWLIVAVYFFEWFVILPLETSQWELLLGAKYAALSFAVCALLVRDKFTLPQRSVIALLAISTVCDTVKYATWQAVEESYDPSPFLAVFFFAWLVFTLSREYPAEGGKIKRGNVGLLILKPNTYWDVLKGLFGYPAASVCICVDGVIWSFRCRSGKFERYPLSSIWAGQHICIDTGVCATETIMDSLKKLEGTGRNPGIKCIWTIRGILKMIGGKYSIKSPFDYIPAFYVMRITT